MTQPSVADLRSRAATTNDDLQAASDLLTRAWLARSPTVNVTPGDLSWWFCQAWPDELGQHLRLWEHEGKQVAWSWHEQAGAEGPAELEYHVWSGDEAVDAAVGRRIVESSLGDAGIEAWASERDVQRVAIYEANGLRRLEPWTPGVRHSRLSQYQRSLDDPIPDALLPDGYRIRPLTGADEIERRVDVHRAAFAPSRMSAGKYERLVTLPDYQFEDDLVVEAPDGSFAAFTMAWWDPVALVGEFEPVGTHPDHQRRGLGKALLAYAVRRYRDLGAELVQVYSSAENAASEALYRSVGFERRAMHHRYRRAVPVPA